MHKLCKRALSLALTLCLLLSVIPAVSAADTDPIVYSFTGKSGNIYNNVRTDFAAGENWYTLASSANSTSLKYSGGALYVSTKYNGYWNAIMIKVEKPGYYNLSATIQGSTGENAAQLNGGFLQTEIWMMDDSYAAAIKATSGRNTAAFDAYPKIAGGVANGTLHHANTWAKSVVYLGNTGYLEAGNYIIGINPKGNTDTSINKRCYVYDITLTPGQTGDAFVQQVSAATYTNGTLNKSQVTGVYQLAADLNAPNAALELGAQDLALNGHTLTVGTVSSAFTEGNDAVKLTDGVISGISGDGTLKVTGGYAPMLPYGGQQAMLLKSADNSYQFTTPGLISGEPFTGQSFMEDPTNTGFAFQIDMAQAAKALVAGGDSGVKVSMEWTLGDTKGTTVQFSNNFVKDWGAGNGDTFYIEVKDIYNLLKEYGAITCTPKISGGNVSFTGKPIVFTGEKQDWDKDGSLKVLFVGNSFSEDTLKYAPQIFKNLGVESVKMAYLYVGGCTLDRHLNYFTNNSASYTYYTSTSGAWSKTASATGYTALEDENWDYICFQQARASSYQADTYGNLNALMDLVEAKCPTARYIWNMTWATDDAQTAYNMTDTEMYNSIVSAVNTKILTNDRIEMVIPTGTAIQNARTSFMGSSEYENYAGWKLTRDGYHLSECTGRYTAALTFAGKLLGLDISKLTWKPANVPADEARVAMESAKNAIATPYAITRSNITEQDTITATGTQLALEIEGNTLWSSTRKMLKYNYISGNSSYSQYANTGATTQSFTKAELPVGTVIEIAEGYSYIPHGWVNSTKNGTLTPAEVMVNKIVVDELWWGEYNYRGFNIYKLSETGGHLKYDSDPQGFQNALKITVPSN